MNKTRPFIITFIGDLCILTALTFILSLFAKFFKGSGIYFEPLPNYLKIPGISENIMRLLIAIALLIISYGYLKLKKWGYWLMVIINLVSLAVWINATHQNKVPFIAANPISTCIALIFILPTIKYFYKKPVKLKNPYIEEER